MAWPPTEVFSVAVSASRLLVPVATSAPGVAPAVEASVSNDRKLEAVPRRVSSPAVVAARRVAVPALLSLIDCRRVC